MTPPTDPQAERTSTLVPSQRAREAAADVWRDYVAEIGECLVEKAMRSGNIDDGLPQVFARFEQESAALATPPQEAREGFVSVPVEMVQELALFADEWDRWQAKGSTSTEMMVRFGYGKARIDLAFFRRARDLLSAAPSPPSPAGKGACEDCGAPMVQTSHDTRECGKACPASAGHTPDPSKAAGEVEGSCHEGRPGISIGDSRSSFPDALDSGRRTGADLTAQPAAGEVERVAQIIFAEMSDRLMRAEQAIPAARAVLAALAPRIDRAGVIEGLPLAEILADADRLAEAVDFGRRTDSASIVDTLRRLAKHIRALAAPAGE